jgi:ParB-like chromosome segregation protein Spo0J
MENYTWLHINSIKIRQTDTMPLNPSTMDLALKLWSRELTPEDLPPIKVQCDENGIYWIKDGRHRYLAIRLCGYTHIKVKTSKK